MKTIRLRPTDVLYFRDGRPMEGSLPGYGAAWPAPHTFNNALHAALHRADISDDARHQPDQVNTRGLNVQEYRFGSLTTVGPFPVKENDGWVFPRPADLLEDSPCPSLLPLRNGTKGSSSLPTPLQYPLTNTLGPSKDRHPPKWISRQAWQNYLSAENQSSPPTPLNGWQDQDIFATESTIGIGIDPASGCTKEGQFYSAQYLRLKEPLSPGDPSWSLGLLATAPDRQKNQDLLDDLFAGSQHILVGGQQRLCQTIVEAQTPAEILPVAPAIEGTRVKWVLLSPAIFPPTSPHTQRGGKAHPGGWLPNWIDPKNGQVQLRSGDSTRQPGEKRALWRSRIKALPPIQAHLRAALIGKPEAITGWGLAASEEKSEGAKSTHLAVPAGSIYYFECATTEAARELADALNWHGAANREPFGQTIVNRRSTLLGEKGYGIGICGPWNFYPANA